MSIEQSKDFFTNRKLSFYSTILMYGFHIDETQFVEDVARKITVVDRHLNKKTVEVFSTDNFTDLFGVPYFLGIVNFNILSTEEIHEFSDYLHEIEEPLPDNFDEELNKELEFQVNSKVIAVGCSLDTKTLPESIRIENSIFKDSEALKLYILSLTKDIEGKGQACSNSIRIYRVLRMYKFLIENKYITKAVCDELFYPDNVSISMFLKDMSILKEIEYGKLAYDRANKKYIL